jgi:2-iminobutanoate/2-iminopropanoate deaminase
VTEIQRIRLPDTIAEPISHYTDAVMAGGFLWISGMLPTDAAGELVGRGDVVAQTEQVFRNIEAVLTAAGLGFTHVVRVTLYLRNVDDRPLINPVRRKYFGESRPASTLVEISRLAVDDALVEIEAVAFRSPDSAPSPRAAAARAEQMSWDQRRELAREDRFDTEHADT